MGFAIRCFSSTYYEDAKKVFRRVSVKSSELDQFDFPLGLGKYLFRKNRQELRGVINRIQNHSELSKLAADFLYREKNLMRPDHISIEKAEKDTGLKLENRLAKSLDGGMCYGRVFSIVNQVTNLSRKGDEITAEKIGEAAFEIDRIFHQIVFQQLIVGCNDQRNNEIVKFVKERDLKFTDENNFDLKMSKEELYNQIKNYSQMHGPQIQVAHLEAKSGPGHVFFTYLDTENKKYFCYDSIDDWDGGLFSSDDCSLFQWGLANKLVNYRSSFHSCSIAQVFPSVYDFNHIQ